MVKISRTSSKELYNDSAEVIMTIRVAVSNWPVQDLSPIIAPGFDCLLVNRKHAGRDQSC